MEVAAAVLSILAAAVAWGAALAFAVDWFLRRRHRLAGAKLSAAVGRGVAWLALFYGFGTCFVGMTPQAVRAGGLPGWAETPAGAAVAHLTAAGVVFATFGRLRADLDVPTWEVAAASAVAAALWLGGPVAVAAGLAMAGLFQ